MNKASVCLLAAAAVALASLAVAQPRGPGSQKGRGAPPPAAGSVTILELFTSEGCSSCPPADELAARYARRGNVIVLGEHVDYWDGLGWKDRFSSPLFSARQQEYGTAMHRSNVYTPQAVVNGEFEGVGSDDNAISRTLAQAARRTREQPPPKISLEIKDSANLRLSITGLPKDDHKYDVVLAITESGLETEVRAGENGGHVLHHAPVVRSMSLLASLDSKQPGEYGAEARLNFRSEWNKDKLQIVVFLQDQTNRHIIGSAVVTP